MVDSNTRKATVLVGMALILTFFIMRPTYEQMYDEALVPYMDGEIATVQEASAVAIARA